MNTRDDGYAPHSDEHYGSRKSTGFGDLLKHAAGSLGGADDSADRVEPHIGPGAAHGARASADPAIGVVQRVGSPPRDDLTTPTGTMPEATAGPRPDQYAQSSFNEAHPFVAENPPSLFGGFFAAGARFDPKTVAISMAIVGILGSAIATWLAYRAGTNAAGGPVPYVQAEYEATKRSPEDPGGIAVPDRDKLVYERLSGAPAGDGIERLLPPPEQPVARVGRPAPTLPNRMPAADAAEDGPVPSAAPARAEPVITALEAPSGQPPARAVVPQPPSAAPAANVEPATQPVILPEPTPPPPVVAADPQPSFLPPTRQEAAAQGTELSETVPVESLLGPAAGSEPAPAVIPAGSWRIQLASLRQETDANGAWDRLRQRHVGILSPLALTVQEARLDAGVYYRIQAGPLADRAAAAAACEALKANGQPCIVVAP